MTWIATEKLPRIPEHPFYDLLNQVQEKAGFHAFEEGRVMSRPWTATDHFHHRDHLMPPWPSDPQFLVDVLHQRKIRICDAVRMDVVARTGGECILMGPTRSQVSTETTDTEEK